MALIGMVALGCGRDAKEGARAVEPLDVSRSASAVLNAAGNAESAAPRASASSESAAPLAAASSETPPVESPPDPANKLRPPLTSGDLEERAAHLLEAVAKNEPALADDFFFPKAPFIPLKDVADPGRYFDQLLATYHRDVAALRAERKDWSDVAFVSFELGTPPTWVAPGKEYNKIGYFRTFGGKLRYRAGDKTKEISVSTIISWGGRWYVTHLSPIRH
jgi:hypothetical protein